MAVDQRCVEQFFKEKFNEIRKKINSTFFLGLDSDVVELHHYTTVEGFKGILESSSLWASEALYLNDRIEIEYGLEVFREEISKVKSRFGDTCAPEKDMLDQATDLLKDMWQDYGVFICCFCDYGDLVTQWRGYGEGGAGVSITFDATALNNLESCTLYKVIYERKKQQDLASSVLRNACDVMKEYRVATSASLDQSDINILRDTVAELLGICIFSLVSSMKHDAFSDEHEYRLVRILNKEIMAESVKFRIRDGVVIPFFAEKVPCSSVNAVLVGPREDAKFIKQSIENFIRLRQEPISVNYSRVPLRV